MALTNKFGNYIDELGEYHPGFRFASSGAEFLRPFRACLCIQILSLTQQYSSHKFGVTAVSRAEMPRRAAGVLPEFALRS